MAADEQLLDEHGKVATVENVLQIIVGGKELLVRSSEIREVCRPGALTPVPMGPDHVIGLANIHGQIVCIVDVGCVTTLPSCRREKTSRTRFLLLRHPVMHVGIWVDEVCSIRHLDKGLLPRPAHPGEGVVQIDCDGVLYDLLDCLSLLN